PASLVGARCGCGQLRRTTARGHAEQSGIVVVAGWRVRDANTSLEVMGEQAGLGADLGSLGEQRGEQPVCEWIRQPGVEMGE
ncbi:unnamed protein product, partial [Ilex paraguariensis]